jgi:TolA-binding protein
MVPAVAEGQRIDSAQTENRINQIGRSVVELQGRIEQLRQQTQQLQQQLDRMQSSHEDRLQRLERGSAKAYSPRAGQAKPLP